MNFRQNSFLLFPQLDVVVAEVFESTTKNMV